MNQAAWPNLPYRPWKATCDTLHRWLQIVGKVRTHLTPWTNHSWQSTLYLTSSGLTTSLIPYAPRPFSIELDFIRHTLSIQTTDGEFRKFDLIAESVSSFHGRFKRMMLDLKIDLPLSAIPDEVTERIPFAQDTLHCSYDPNASHQFWLALVKAYESMTEFRSHFIGKCSPVHFFWGALDLACTRFSGRRAPEHPGGFPGLSDRVVKDAYSHEVSSCGFWPGNDQVPYPAFYSYAYPQPPAFEKAKVPEHAFYHETLREFILPYEIVQHTKDPQKLLLEFFQSTYEAAANLGKWDRDLLEHSRFLSLLQTA